MKKLLAIACCIAGGAATAQSVVTVSGTVDAFGGRLRNAGDAGSTTLVQGGGLSTSWFGFSATEDLGGGMSASVRLASFFRTGSGAFGRFDGDAFFSKDSNVSLSGGFGTITVGRYAAPNFPATVLSNPFAESFVFSPLVLHSDVNTAKWTQRTTPADTLWNNQVAYTTPTFGGFRATLNYEFENQPSTSAASGRHNIGGSAVYAQGPLTLTGFYERAQVSNPVTAPIVTSISGTNALTTKKDWMVGGSYDLKFVKAFASYGQSTWDVLNFKTKTGQAGVSVPVGSANILADIAQTKVSGPLSSKRTTASVAYDYYLSKRTDIYAVLMHDSVTALSSGNSFGIGLRHRF